MDRLTIHTVNQQDDSYLDNAYLDSNYGEVDSWTEMVTKDNQPGTFKINTRENLLPYWNSLGNHSVDLITLLTGSGGSYLVAQTRGVYQHCMWSAISRTICWFNSKLSSESKTTA